LSQPVISVWDTKPKQATSPTGIFRVDDLAIALVESSLGFCHSIRLPDAEENIRSSSRNLHLNLHRRKIGEPWSTRCPYGSRRPSRSSSDINLACNVMPVHEKATHTLTSSTEHVHEVSFFLLSISPCYREVSDRVNTTSPGTMS
jgi:hypothetical protein